MKTAKRLEGVGEYYFSQKLREIDQMNKAGKKVINLGQIKDNWDLSVLRATSVTRYLTDVEKIDPKRLTATGKSQYQPIDPGVTPDALAKNRRIEIVLSPKLDEIYNLIKQ